MEENHMNIIESLLDADPSVKRMTQKYLLDMNPDFVEDGWISRFLGFFDSETGTWGGGIYGPKWISTFYTLRDLASLEIRPDHPIYQIGLDTLIKHMWSDKWHEDDVCVVAMLVSLLTYGQSDSKIVDDMISYLIGTQLKDGGWNCAITYKPSDKSSINTTLSVLEAYRDYEQFGYTTHLKTVLEQTIPGQDYLLKRHLMYRLTNDELVISYIKDFHFPTRWKYDVLRALCYFASVNYEKVPELSEGLSLLKNKFKKGYLHKGPTYTGKHHFKMETGKIGTMNTLRGLMVLRTFEPDEYYRIINME
jgi:hypothetical protein